jgi:hypothetical protein
VTIQRIIREPLLHFLLLGAGIFAFYNRLPNRDQSERGRIVITQGKIEHLTTGFAMIWKRQPTSDELAGLVRDHVREEVYCREAMALGLDKDDTVIRRRLRQKMEFVSDDIAAQVQPTDADLSAYLGAHPEQFRVDPRFTFQQVYLNREQHGTNLARDTDQLKSRLPSDGKQADVSALGDSSLLESRFTRVSVREVAGQFGEKFANALMGLKPSQWIGPVESSYGLHWVWVSDKSEGRIPLLSEVRDAVRREWENTRRMEANEKVYQDLIKRYVVSIERPTLTEPKKLAEAQ